MEREETESKSCRTWGLVGCGTGLVGKDREDMQRHDFGYVDKLNFVHAEKSA